ncbi:MAG: PoNi-like cognate immunity protein [Coriobacteriia bacterium]|nr:PoNi-like cognate immunity protein [Coriobacteriia bacterium]
MRDTLKDKEWFDNRVTSLASYTEDIKDDLTRGPYTTQRIGGLSDLLHQAQFDLWQARFSRGDPVSELVAPFRELMLDYVADFVPAWYTDSLWLLSIGVMLEVDDEAFGTLAGTVVEQCREDWLYNYLIHSRLPEVGFEESPLLWSKPYQVLRQIVEEAEDKPAAMQRYLKRSWYRSHSSTGWYDSHKSAPDIYTGYWSYESGAVAKILKLDDSSLEGLKYYPYDLVHYKA